MSVPTQELRILIVVNDPKDRATCRRLLTLCSKQHYVVIEAEWGAEALQYCRSENPDCVLLDHNPPNFDGLEFLAELRSTDDPTSCPVIMLTGQGDESVAAQIMERGAEDCLVKCELEQESLHRAIHNAVEKTSLRRKLHEAREELKVKNRRLYELHKTAHQWADNVSAEFQSPLTVIKQFASIVAEGLAGEINDEQKEYLNIVNERVNDMSCMVEDMLDLGKLEAGTLEVFREECWVDDIVEGVRTTLERKDAIGNVQLDIDVDGDLPPVYCDAKIIGRVIVNLAANALNISGDGHRVTIWTRYDAEHAQIAVGVTDNGPGIAPDDLKVIAERFKQLDGPARLGIKGFGLGLNIAKQLVQLNFGTINVESQLGRGSTFSIAIPTSEPRGFLQRYLPCVHAMRSGLTHVTILRGQVDHNVEPTLLDDVSTFLQKHVRRTDLVIRSQPHEWLLIAPANQTNLDSMIGRIAQAWDQANRYRLSDSLPPIILETVGSWLIDDQREEFIQACETAWKPKQHAHV